MTEEAISALFENMPGWFYLVASLLILVILGSLGVWAFLGAKRFAEGVNKENRMLLLYEELSSVKKECGIHKGVASQFFTSVENAEHLIKGLIDLRQEAHRIENESVQGLCRHLIQRSVDALASDIKHRAGERHRCGFWAVQDDGTLKLLVASAGFPDYYVGERYLEINRSIAGRAFRKRERIKVDNVEDDVDWQRNANSSSPYKSIVCIPVGAWGVITIDALNPMNDEVKVIGQLYARIVEGALVESAIAFNSAEYAAPTVEEFEEE